MTTLRALGSSLRAAGLRSSALAAWAGTDRLSALASHLPSSSSARGPAAVLALCVAGVEVDLDAAPAALIDGMIVHGLVDRDGGRVRARFSILPISDQLVVCDRIDASRGADLVCWPDDSSYHLASAIAGGRRSRWIDLATGSAFAPLSRPGLASRIEGIDLNPRAVDLARIGAALSGVEHLELSCGDVATPREPAPLVTCNAPIPASSAPGTSRASRTDSPWWYVADAGFFERMWSAARAMVAPGGEVVVHARLDAVPDSLEGEVVSVIYTPAAMPPFAVTWWCPDGAPRRVTARRTLVAQRPHLDPCDRDDARSGHIVPILP